MHRRSFRHAFMAAAAIAAGLVVVAATGGTASAAIVSQSLDCGIGGSQTATLDTSAPATVKRGNSFTVTLAPSGPAGKADGAEIKNMVTTFQAPAGSTIVAGSASTSGGSGTLGAVSTEISGSTVKLKVPGPIANGASFVNPTLTFDLTATGVAGTNLAVKFKSSGGYTLTAAGSFNVSCNASPQASLTSTIIEAAETTTTTTTSTPGGSTTTTQPQPVVSYVDWSPTTSCGTVASTTAPADTESVTITAAGGNGGNGGGQGGGSGADKGAGGTVVSTFAATAGQSFSAVVGCNGANGGNADNSGTTNGYSLGGGTGRGSVIAGITGASGGRGGGSSAVCTSAGCKASDLSATPIVVAGGGGGGGVSNCAGTPAGRGGDGGSAGSTALGGGAGNSGGNGAQGGNSGGSTGGGGGGAGGVNSNGGSGNGGSAPNGSGGLGLSVVGGGGGGGYIGGNAGGNSNTGCKGAGGGGGGSSWAANSGTATTFGTATTGGAVTLRFKVVTDPVDPPCVADLTPFPSTSALVTQQYQDFEGRAPTAGEISQWTTDIDTCAQTADDLIVSLLETDQTLDEARLVRLYLAFFKRPPDPSGYAFWQNRLDQGYGLIRAADHFANSSEFIRTYGSLSNEDFIELVYQNVLDRPSDPNGKAFWLNRLNNRTANRGTVMINFSESSENTREKVDAVQVFRIFRGMRGRFPLEAEYFALLDPINDSGKTLEDVANAVRTSQGYADRVIP